MWLSFTCQTVRGRPVSAAQLLFLGSLCPCTHLKCDCGSRYSVVTLPKIQETCQTKPPQAHLACKLMSWNFHFASTRGLFSEVSLCLSQKPPGIWVAAGRRLQRCDKRVQRISVTLLRDLWAKPSDYLPGCRWASAFFRCDIQACYFHVPPSLCCDCSELHSLQFAASLLATNISWNHFSNLWGFQRIELLPHGAVLI